MNLHASNAAFKEGMRVLHALAALCAAAMLPAIPARAVELKPEAATAFDHYIRAVETRMDEDVREDHFLAVDRLTASRSHEAYAQLRRGQTWISPVQIREDGQTVSAPGAIIHHWVGAVFISGAALADVVAVLHDYDRHQDVYQPRIRKSKLVAHDGDEWKTHLQLFNKSIVTAVLNADFDIHDTQFGPERYQIAMRSTRIADVVNVDTPDERELTPGSDHGYLWRFRSYWRLEEKDGGVYAQNESVFLSRSVPAILAWLFNPFVKDLPRDILTHLLTDTRNAVVRARVRGSFRELNSGGTGRPACRTWSGCRSYSASTGS